MLNRIAIIMVMVFVLVACDILAETEDAGVIEAESVAEVATDIPTLEPATEVIVEDNPTEVPIVQATTEPTDVPVVQPTDVPPTIEPTDVPVDNAYNGPDWASFGLVNARTGEAFTLADFAGKTVFVEPMATWCSNCRAQQGYVSEAMASLSSDDYVFISLSVGENVSNEVLAAYAERNGFPQIFAVATPDLTNALVNVFGFSVTNPPSTPHFTISPNGTVSELSTGFHRADALITEVTAVNNG